MRLQLGTGFLDPVKIDKHGPVYRARDVALICLASINSGNYFEGKARDAMSDTESAIAKTEEVTKRFEEVLNRFLDTENKFANQSKRAAGTVREASERLAQGMAKVEKAANFDRLERYVLLLERAASAMTTLAEIDAAGKLEKIAEALR